MLNHIVCVTLIKHLVFTIHEYDTKSFATIMSLPCDGCIVVCLQYDGRSYDAQCRPTSSRDEGNVNRR